ncbi:hypothetical protein F4810DRAFT_660166 [Camillea tinctor]|nr:hypothetical protein F4810DRAFT_660166 [Camillea tinctor]
MENLPFEIIATSKTFRFLVGLNKKEFILHAALVAHLSKPLATLVNGQMKEAREGYAEVPEFDEGTFALFCQFAYTGDYKVPLPLPRSITPNSTPAPIPGTKAQPRTANRYAGTPIISLDSSRSCVLCENFRETTYTIPGPHPPPEGTLLTGPPKTMSEVFLSHARVYVLADYYDIDRLKIRSLVKLHYSLANFELKSETLDYIVVLTEYCFKNTVDKGNEKDQLRELVLRYVAWKVDKLWKSNAFHELLDGSAEVSKSVIGAMIGGKAPW